MLHQSGRNTGARPGQSKITKSQHRVSLQDSIAFMQLLYDFQQTLMYETGGHLSVS